MQVESRPLDGLGVMRCGGDRHNVGRIPELGFFACKLFQGQHWSLPFTKASAAQPIPSNFASEEQYLDQMQAHAALEFQAACQAALLEVDGSEHTTPERKWYRFSSQPHSAWWVADSRQLDFEEDPWSKHIIQVQEADTYHIVRSAKRVGDDKGDKEDKMMVLPIIPHQGPIKIRSLGFMGSHLLQYNSAQELKYTLCQGQLPSSVKRLLTTVANPKHWHASSGNGTLTPSSPNARACLREDVVPVNAGQREAVLGLQGGLSMIHGPPGTGKSTTIFHIIDGRVRRGRQALVTCTRNQAVDAVVSKVSKAEGSILVFGHGKRLGERAKCYTLKAREEQDPGVRLWLQHVHKLQELERYKGRATDKVLPAVNAVVIDAGKVGWLNPEHLRSLSRLRHKLQGDASNVGQTIVRPLLDILLHHILPQVKNEARRAILRSTHLFVCTIDSTPRLVWGLEERKVPLQLDTVVVDEAGCVLEMAIPMLLHLHPANLVLVGDHRQLQAYSDLKSPPQHHCRSLIERAAEQGVPATMLTQQYRMHPSICAAVSSLFYSSRLVTAPETAARRSLARACKLVHVNGREVHHPMAGYSNKEEAERVVQQALLAARQLQKKGIARPSIYIISLYNKQRGLISELLGTLPDGKQLSKLSNCQVLSVDASQGSEADAVVLSTVRNVAGSRASLTGVSSFFCDQRRINVALSRARHLSVLVGSMPTLMRGGRQGVTWKAIVKHYTGK